MHDRIIRTLADIEIRERCRILYACESGSRAWGFASRDSDYDARFIYVRELEWYLRVDQGANGRLRSVIELPIGADLLDVNGWDLRKALWLMSRSNPPLLEWLHSPIVYRDGEWVLELRELAGTFYSPTRCMQHYLHMADGNFREYLRGERVHTKKYFYVLRPLLACRWIEAGLGVSPVEFDRLLERCLPTGGGLPQIVGELLARKRSGDELAEGDRIDALNDFLCSEVARLKSVVSDEPNPTNLEPLHDFFRRVVGA